MCPRDYAVSGFRGSSAQYVNQIEIQCRALAPNGSLTGTDTYLGSSGGTGGTAQGLQTAARQTGLRALRPLQRLARQFRHVVPPVDITPVSVNSMPVVVNPGATTWVAGIP